MGERIMTAQEKYTPRFEEKYKKVIAPALKAKLGYKNIHEIPAITKIVLNMGISEAAVDKKHIESGLKDMALIAGQKPVATIVRKSNASFKIREGMQIGAKVTLRGKHMYEFLDRLVNISLPRVRDFRGVNPNAFDGRGNYNMGLKEQLMFPEIDYDKVESVRGMDICFVTTAKTDDEGRALLRAFDMPFRK